MSQHDRGYGFADSWPLGETAEDKWLEISRTGFYMPCSDPTMDLVVKLHLRRLTGWMESPDRQALQAEMDQVLRTQIAQTDVAFETWQRADRIIRFCDNIAFDFCFEQPVSGSVAVFPRNSSDEEISLHYAIEPGAILVQPWPFSVASYTGYLIGYRLQGYPEVLDPVLVPFELAELKAENF